MPTPLDLLDADRPDSLATASQVVERARREHISFFPSPLDWRDQVLYFLLPDRFSDGNEEPGHLLTRDEITQLRQAAGRPDWSWKGWAESGKQWQGGTLKGIQGQLDYLQGLGVTTLWVGPVFKQRVQEATYHGYGIQDFLEVDPRFGSRRDLVEMIQAAHDRQIRVILDIIVNHSGDNWGYVGPESPPEAALNEPTYRPWADYYGNPEGVATRGWGLAWRDAHQTGFTPQGDGIADRHAGVWPRELQSPSAYTRAGKGSLAAGDIADPHAEHKRTDFFALKDFALDGPDTLAFLSQCYRYWIALTDCDGFRIDTVKHMSLEETRNFCGAIQELAESLGKRNFLLVGEIAGGDDFQDFVLDNLAVMQRNLSAALDIGSARKQLHDVAKGLAPGSAYLNSFDASSAGFGSHRSLGDRHVSILDDHDHVIGHKLRFSATIPDDSPVKDRQVVVATALQLFTLGIPCIYYGSEQAFAGPAQSQLPFLGDEGWDDPNNYGDRYLREAMFGPVYPRADATHDLDTQVAQEDPNLPGFGPFGTAGKHCFDPDSPAYVRIATLCQARAEHTVLRIGRQYPRQIRLPGTGFDFPRAGELVAWSRILDTVEAVCVVNPNGDAARGGDVVVSAELCPPGTELTVVANTAATCHDHASHPVGSTLTVKGHSYAGEPCPIPTTNAGQPRAGHVRWCVGCMHKARSSVP